MTSPSTVRPVPDLTEPRVAPIPARAERVLGSGLKVIAVRRDAVPLVEVRLRMPFAGSGDTYPAQAEVLAQTLMSGTEERTNVQIAAALQEVGGGLSASVDPDRLAVSGNSLEAGLPHLLDVLAEILTGATYPEAEVASERARLADQIQIAESQPSHAVRKALLRRLYGSHPYAVETPEPEQVRGIQPDVLRALHASRVQPSGSTLVIVGDIEPEATLDTVDKALGSWKSSDEAPVVPAVPSLESGPLLLVNRPGSVQSSVRLALSAIGRAHEDYAALQLANLVFGGYFSSRLVENIREDKGYTYSPHSRIDHSVAGSMLMVSADVATEVTAPALLEISYELGKIASLPPKPEELEQARQYAIGTLALSVASQAGLAGTLSALAGTGLGLEWLTEHSLQLARTTVEEVQAAASRYLAPSKGVTVVLGDADVVEPSVSGLGPVQRA